MRLIGIKRTVIRFLVQIKKYVQSEKEIARRFITGFRALKYLKPTGQCTPEKCDSIFREKGAARKRT